MKAAELVVILGDPPHARGCHDLAQHFEIAWPQVFGGVAGWWCALIAGDEVVTVAWHPGSARQRDEELIRMRRRAQSCAHLGTRIQS